MQTWCDLDTPPKSPCLKLPLSMSSSIPLCSIICLMLHQHHAPILSFNPLHLVCSTIWIPVISISSTSGHHFDGRSSAISLLSTNTIWIHVVFVPSTSNHVDRHSSTISIPSTSGRVDRRSSAISILVVFVRSYSTYSRRKVVTTPVEAKTPPKQPKQAMTKKRN
jgi:hypothetical protein